MIYAHMRYLININMILALRTAHETSYIYKTSRSVVYFTSGAGTAYPCRSPEFTCFSGVCVARYLDFCPFDILTF